MTSKTFKSGTEARKYFEGLEPIAGGYFDYFTGAADTRKQFADKFTWMNAGDEIELLNAGLTHAACGNGILSCIFIPDRDSNWPIRAKIIREGFKKCRGPQDWVSLGQLKKTARQLAIDEASEINNALTATPTRSAASASRL